jgi:centrosomal protein CEP78
LFSVTPEFMALIKSFSLTIGKSLDLVSFGIRDVRLSNEAIQLLGHGIQTAQSLKELELRSCSLSTQSLALIEFALSQNSSLIAIDLQRNFLTEGSGLII